MTDDIMWRVKDEMGEITLAGPDPRTAVLDGWKQILDHPDEKSGMSMPEEWCESDRWRVRKVELDQDDDGTPWPGEDGYTYSLTIILENTVNQGCAPWILGVSAKRLEEA